MRIGFIVNPIAGMGGRVGLKGTDGVVKEAIAKGATPVAPKRAVEFLRGLKEVVLEKGSIKILTCPGIMGMKEAEEVNIPVQVLPMKIGEETTAEDTKQAVKLLCEMKVDLIVFVGGDGTAKDILDALKLEVAEIPVLGVPSGVKMYSGVFAVNPSDAAEVVLAFLSGKAEIEDFEVMDADEEAIRNNILSVRLYGYLKTPFVPLKIQGSKELSPDTVDEKENQIAIARFIVEEMKPNATYLMGPGTTVKCIADMLHVPKTLLGVDIYKNGTMILDVDERRILENIDDWQNTWIILSPIGRQGILLGRGNQQISPEIIKRVGKQRIIVVATKSKLRSIEGNILRVDTGDAEADDMLKGYIRVVTDYREWRLMSVR